MTKKIYLGSKNNRLYITETGTSYTDQSTFKEVSRTLHSLDDLANVSKDLEEAAKVITTTIGRKTRPFELYIGSDLQPIMTEIEKIMHKYLPNATVLKYEQY